MILCWCSIILSLRESSKQATYLARVLLLFSDKVGVRESGLQMSTPPVVGNSNLTELIWPMANLIFHWHFWMNSADWRDQCLSKYRLWSRLRELDSSTVWPLASIRSRIDYLKKFPVTFFVVNKLTVFLTFPSKLSSSTSMGIVQNA